MLRIEIGVDRNAQRPRARRQLIESNEDHSDEGSSSGKKAPFSLRRVREVRETDYHSDDGAGNSETSKDVRPIQPPPPSMRFRTLHVIDGQGAEKCALSCSEIVGTDHLSQKSDDHNTFLAGALVGVGGGAIIGAIQEGLHLWADGASGLPSALQSRRGQRETARRKRE